MNKTIYVRDEDVSVWERARELAGDKLSPVIAEALKKYVAEKEITSEGFERIVVNYQDLKANNLLRSKAFQGKWLIAEKEKVKGGDSYGQHTYVMAVALTPKENFVVVRYETNTLTEVPPPALFSVHESIDDMADDLNGNYGDVVTLTQKRYGIVPVEELDI